jgi:hypothetical protein
MEDARGLDVTRDSAEALAAVDDFARRLVALAQGAEAVLAAVSLLWRLEMAGEDRPARWPAIAERVAAWVAPCFQPFLAAHWAYALARAGRDDDLARLLRAADEQARHADPDATRAWRPVGRALVEAAAAFGSGRVRQCVTLLEPVAADVTVVGGSDAQCDLFRLLRVRALAASGRRADARRALARLFEGKRSTPLDARWIAWICH